ncbi:MAG: hypothetical protein KDE27_27170 [Planctomycetes bacterium]|nr:hypothetical protein [Planctomycetota bacterium]
MKAALAGVVVGTAMALAQQPVPAWRAVLDVGLRGNYTIPREEILEHLLADADVQAMLGAALGPEQMPDLARAVERFYRANGYPAATARVDEDSDRVVEIREERRQVLGAIVIEGPADTPVDAIRSALHGDSTARPHWREGEPIAADAGSLARARTIVEAACLAEARFGARFALRFATRADDPGIADLAIEFTDAGRAVPVRGVRLTGERPAEVDTVVGLLRWDEGAVFSAGLVLALKDQLMALGRYRSVELVVPPEAAAAFDALEFRVEVLPHAPPLDAAARRDIEQVRRAFAWFESQLAGGRTVQIRGVPLDDTGIGFLPGTGRFDGSTRGFGFAAPGLQVGGTDSGPIECLITASSVAFAGGTLVADLTAQHPIAMTAHVTSSFDADGRCEFRWGFGAHTDESLGLTLDFDLHPATAGYLLFGPDPLVHRDGDDLVFTAGEGEMRFGPDGTPREPRFELANGATIEFFTATLDDLRHEFTARHPGSIRTAEAFGQAVAAAIAELTTTGAVEHADPIDALLEGLQLGVARALTAAPKGTAEPTRYRLPNLDGASQMGSLAFRLGTWTGCDGWFAELAGAIGTLACGHARAAWDQMTAFGERERYGPVAMLGGAATMAFLGQQRATQWFRSEAERRWSFEAVWRDLIVLAAPFDAAERARAAVANAWRNDERLTTLFADIDTNDDDAMLEHGARMLWNAGLGEALHRLVSRVPR